MKKNVFILGLALVCCAAFVSCEKEKALKVPKPDVISEPANCYVIKSGSFVQFPTNVGNTDEKVNVESLNLLWQDAQGLVEEIKDVKDGYAQVKFAEGLAGNAVFAGRDAAGKTLWSWHCWVVDELPQDVAVGGVTFMDRNIGALTADFKKAGFTGTVYNWGRKDAFAGLDDNGFLKAMFNFEGDTVKRAFVEATEADYIASATENPLTVYFQTSTNYKKGNYSWISADYASIDENKVKALWNNNGAKAVADPCPAGYAVASQADWTALKEAATEPAMLVDEAYKVPEDVSSKWAEKYVNQYEHQVQFRAANLAGLLVNVSGEINCNKADALNIANGVGSLQPSATIWTSSMDPDYAAGCSYSNFRAVAVKQNASWSSADAKLNMNALNVKAYQNLSYELPVRCIKK